MKSVFAIPAVTVVLVAWPVASRAEGEAELPPEIRNVKIVQKHGSQVPFDAQFQDSTGETVALGRYFRKRPVILVLAYYRCPRLCSRVLNELMKTLRQMSLDLGDDFSVVTISFDPRETPGLAAAKKQAYLSAYGRRASGWYFLTGKDPDIKRVADAVGFRYVWDEKRNQYQHSTAIMVLTPAGKVSRYYFGLSYAPRDVQLGLVEASDDRIGTPVDQVLLLTCLSYNPSTGKYTVAVFKLMRVAAVVTVLIIVGYLVWNWRQDRRRHS